MLKKEIFYIADFSLPNKSAYALHVLKMCDAFREMTGKKVNLFIPFRDTKYKYSKIKKDYLLKNIININGIFLKKRENNFFLRILFALKIIYLLKKNSSNYYIYSRSIISSILLGFFKIKNTLEVHTELTGATKKLFYVTNFNFINSNIKFVFINDYLRKKLKISKNKSLILGDAVDYRDFNSSKSKIIKNTCFYSGSFVKGKGLEIIFRIAKKMPHINFHLYGNTDTIYNKKLLKHQFKNVCFKGYLNYSKLTREIKKYRILLLPYSRFVGVLIEGINVVKYFSPLKMFDYLASGKIIIATNLKVYKNILKNNQNSILIKENIDMWCYYIDSIFKNKKYDHLGVSAKNDSKKYSWNSRVKNILEHDLGQPLTRI